MFVKSVSKFGAILKDKTYEKYIHIPITSELNQKLFAAMKLPRRFTSVSLQAAPLHTLQDLDQQIRAHKDERAKLMSAAVSFDSRTPQVRPAIRIEELGWVRNEHFEGDNRQSSDGGGGQVTKGAVKQGSKRRLLSYSEDKPVLSDARLSPRWSVLDCMFVLRFGAITIRCTSHGPRGVPWTNILPITPMPSAISGSELIMRGITRKGASQVISMALNKNRWQQEVQVVITEK